MGTENPVPVHINGVQCRVVPPRTSRAISNITDIPTTGEKELGESGSAPQTGRCDLSSMSPFLYKFFKMSILEGVPITCGAKLISSSTKFTLQVFISP